MAVWRITGVAAATQFIGAKTLEYNTNGKPRDAVRRGPGFWNSNAGGSDIGCTRSFHSQGRRRTLGIDR